MCSKHPQTTGYYMRCGLCFDEQVDRVAALEAELAECKARCKELADKYVGDLGVELQRLGRENDELKAKLAEALSGKPS